MNLSKNATRFVPFAAVGLALCGTVGMSTLAGCGGGGQNGSATSAVSQATGRAALVIKWPTAAQSRLIPTASNSILVNFSRDGKIVSTQTIVRPTGSDQTTTTFSNLPVGSLTVAIAAFPNADATGTAQAGATTTLVIASGQDTPLTVTLASTIASVAVTPAASSVVLGATTTLAAAAYNAAGEVVLTTPSKTTFVSSDTTVATINAASGVVTGTGLGTATITATETESGIAGSTTVTVTAAATPTPSPTPTPGTSIVDLANAYIATLSTAQQTATVVSNNAVSAEKWSNLPATPTSSGTTSLRNGVAYSTLTATQKAAWVALVQAALSANGSNAYTQLTGIRAADSYLGTNLNANGYSGDYEYVGIVGTPSTTGGWMLQVGGHHNAHNYYFTGTTLNTTTPYHIGVEPTSFTYSGAAYTPLGDQKTAVTNLLSSFSTTQLASAKLSGSFGDLFLGAGQDARSNFPTGTTGRGILTSSLTTAQQALVKSAINAWVKNSPLSSTYTSVYEAELASTYVGYAGNGSAPGTVFTAQGDYLRIDGPHVWIEFVCQNGIVVQGQIHYHTIWRDRTSDYNYQTAGYTLYNHSNGGM